MTEYLSRKIKVISFISIVMVVILHCYNLDKSIYENEKNITWFIQTIISFGITRIAVPVFFIISGYLFFLTFNGNSDFVLKMKKRFRTLVVPYLFWSFFGIFFYYTLQSIPQTQSFFTKKLIKDCTIYELFDLAFLNIIPYQFWFIRDLIVLTILSPVIYFLLKKLSFWLLLFIFPFWFLNQDSIFFSSESLLFFSFGVFLVLKHPEIIKVRMSKKITFVLIISWIAFLLLKIILQIYNFSEIWVQTCHKTSILFGIVAFWTLYDLLYKDNFRLSTINNHTTLFGFTFFIYAAHEPILTIIKKSLFYILGKEQDTFILVYALSPFLVIGICLIIGTCLKNKLPRVFDFMTGNR
ncbi:MULTISPECIES: acyltransferase [Flavobacterium]|uniref:acyltransferase n=1 Tax=Flavobacterium TaxID=237 RepID=UPI002807F081|nr:acyltransferase [Flavobacterium lindanitolerans]MDQ7959309.1 acyltransferase [Flavobacterium lindanitolerans]